MAHLLRGKQAGIQNDLSAGITSDLFAVDDLGRYGVGSQISQIAYDPVQSLLAVGTNDTQFGPGQIYIFGQKRVNAVLPLPKRASVKALQFCADKLLCLDSKHDLSIYSLETKKLLAGHSAPGIVTALHSDPTLDYALLGMQNGDVMAYDLDREAPAPFKIPNLWKEINPRARAVPVVTLQFHPRDIGSLLIGYMEGACIYSFKQNKAVKFFHYELPRGAPGGDSDPASMSMARSPKLTQAVWHPTGTFILTGHEDSSLVFWDPKDGRIVMARTLADTNVDRPEAGNATPGGTHGTFALKEPIFSIAWCANVDPDDTAILVAGGAPTTMPTKGLTLFELGRTPNYATSSWQVLSSHFESPRRQRILPTPPNAEVIDFCLIPRTSPHFAGAQDPIAIIALMSSGEIITLSFPSGHPISPTNQLHLSLTFVHPFIIAANLSTIERQKWLGMTEHRAHGPLILTGGKESSHPLKRFEGRNVAQTAHADGTVRLWDAGHADEIENEELLQVDVARAVGRCDGVEVTRMSLAGATGEFAAGLRSGELVVFRWNHNRNAGREPPRDADNAGPGQLTNVTGRADPSLHDGLLPFTLLDQQDGPCTALQLSDVGFVAAAFEGGSLVIIDLRGPAIIYTASVTDFIKENKRGSFRRSGGRHGDSASKPEWVTVLEFSVMTLDGDDYSSLLLHAGTNLGHLATFQLLPGQGGRYSARFAGAVALDHGDRVVSISTLSADDGGPARATQRAVAGLRDGSTHVNGVVLAVGASGARLFRAPGEKHKGASKTWDEALCDAAALTWVGGPAGMDAKGVALVGLFGDGFAKAFSLPGLKEIAKVKLDGSAAGGEGPALDVRRFADAVVTQTGDVLGWAGPSEMALVNVWGSGLNFVRSKDTLFNPDSLIPPRPTISNLQWISGTQYITPADMDLLIGGPDRPPSKRMIAQARAEEQQRRAAARAGGSSSSAPQDEGYWASMQRAINERTEKLGIVGDNMDRLQENSNSWADDVNKFVNKQKRGFVMGAMKSKFGL
ncbi:lethal giant larvae like, C-terminal-domain-containing protein [Lineolata rhizophorae]|uniref:Lethal giant larvae like, C-terminal-domain-containing protein n=1 Tax=Lineolata rhizophorae TaxID=578093 RepID=A0A6A6P6E2_9PEZI|nr:lethal giant larvae like, C-terminal-domain-containing protein [Lineolata rhizophorae]